MKNQDQWKPSKFVYRNGRLVASRNRKEVGVASRLAADLIAGFYDENLKRYAKGRLLDLGCGKVPLYHAYREYVEEIICVDWENTLHKNEHLDLECDLTQALPFTDGEFDTIVLSAVLEHIPEPDHLWSEMARILSLDGKIIMNVPFYYWLHECPHDYYRYTEFALRRFVENSGLKLVHLEPLGGAPEIVADILAKNLQHIPLFGKGLAILIQSITGFCVTTRIGNRISGRTKHLFPFGYVLIAQKAE